jgi:uncharacterized protein
MGDVQAGNIMVVLSSALTGIAFGFVIQRGRYCMNAGFRSLAFTKDFTMFRAYLIAILVAIVGANLLDDLGLIRGGLIRQPFAPFANMIGGYVFGMGIMLAGRGTDGMFFRIGEGMVAAFVTAVGFVVGILQTSKGILSPLYTRLRSFEVGIGVNDGPALWDIFGGHLAKWFVIAVIVALIAPYILKNKPFEKGQRKGFSWALTGLFVGVIVVVALWASARWGGKATGLSLTQPSSEFFLAVLFGDSRSADPMFNFFGLFNITWAALYIPFIPIGAFISAKGLGEFKLKTTSVQDVIWGFLGGFIMGFGAILAGGDTVGHSLTGMAALSVASIVSTLFFIFGNWSIVYYKLISPTKDQAVPAKISPECDI